MACYFPAVERSYPFQRFFFYPCPKRGTECAQGFSKVEHTMTDILHDKPTVFIETYGCQMNVLDTELVRDQLESMGYRFVESATDASIVLLNTCSVRDLSEQKVWSQLGRLAVQKTRTNSDLVVGVLGCMAERENQGILDRAPHVDLLCGPSNLDAIPSLVDDAWRNRGQRRANAQVSLSGHTSRRSKTLEAAADNLEALDLSRAFSPSTGSNQAYVRITRGCNKFCTYCVVPYTRGAETHRSPGGIIEEVQRLVSTGIVEVTLLGQTVNHYAYKDGGKTTSFADLLWSVHEAVPELQRLRFLTSYPRDFSDDALDVMAQASRICRYLHIPAQSGSNSMLRSMNRGYTVEDYRALLERARSRMPDIRLAGDMIVGFSGEMDADHQASIELLRAARYKSCFIFKYSPRPGTVADKRLPDDVPDEIKKRRNIELLEVQSEISQQHNEQWIGQELQVLVERRGKLRKDRKVVGTGDVQLGWKKPTESQEPEGRVRLTGRTSGDEIVAFDGPQCLIGQVTNVYVHKATPLTLLGECAQP